MSFFSALRKKIDIIIRPVQTFLLNICLFLVYFLGMGIMKFAGAHKKKLGSGREGGWQQDQDNIELDSLLRQS